MALKASPLLQALLLLPLVLSCPHINQSKPSEHMKLFNHIQRLEGSKSLGGQNFSELYHGLNFKEFICSSKFICSSSNHPGITDRKHTGKDELDNLEDTTTASQSENYLKFITDILGLVLMQNLL